MLTGAGRTIRVLTKLKAGARGYDIAVPSDYMVTILAKSGLFVPLNMDLIPNFADVMPRFQRPTYDTWPDGKKYSVPYDWGTTGIGVRIDVIDDPITRWADLWNPAHKRKIQLLSDEREVVGACLKMLGYSYNATDQAPRGRTSQGGTRFPLQGLRRAQVEA